MSKRRTALFVICIITFITAICMFAGCKLNETLDDIIAANNLKARVTYFSNGGNFGNEELHVKEMYFRDQSKALNIGFTNLTSGSLEIARDDYALIGWYKAELNDDGKVVYEDGTVYEDGADYDLTKNIKASDELFDFSKPLSKGEHHYLCAKWQKDVKLLVKAALESGETITYNSGGTTITYSSGDELGQFGFGVSGTVSRPGDILSASNMTERFTFVEYYLEPECENIVTFPLSMPEGDEDLVIYAKYIKGVWSIVKTPNDVANMFTSQSLNSYFIRDIDCSGISAVNNMNYFSGKIEGNGYTVRNLKVKTNGYLRSGEAAVFGEIAPTAAIKNITFENLTFSCQVANNANLELYFVFKKLNEGAVISDVTVGGKLSIVNLGTGALVTNLYKNDEYSGSDHWLFGGFETDSLYTDITISPGTTYEKL